MGQVDVNGEGSTGSPAKQRVRRKVSRTRAGCITCKARRKRCDMVKPNCGDCTRLNLECEWAPVRRLSRSRQGSNTLSVDDGSGRLHEPIRASPTSAVSSTFHADIAPAPFSSGSQTEWPAFRPDTSVSMPSLPVLDQLSHNRTDVAEQDMFGGNLFPPQSNPIDDAILQLWAEACAPFLAAGDPQATARNYANPSLPSRPSSLRTTTTTEPPLAITPSTPLPKAVPDTETQTEILTYFRECLTGLMSYDEVQFPDSLHAFNATASTNIGNGAGRALHCGILALASRHMVNKGQTCMERISEQLGVEGSEIIMERLKGLERIQDASEEEATTLLAGLLMHVIYKVCRGDVWGFDSYLDQAKRLCTVLFPLEAAAQGLSTNKLSFLENVVFHDSCGTSVYARGPIIQPNISMTYANTQRGVPHALTGLALPLYCIVPRISKLVQQSWTHRSGRWVDSDLSEALRATEEIEASLEQERLWLEQFISERPDMMSHRYFHDAYRIACLLQLKCFVLNLPPDALIIRSLARNALSLLETMEMLSLPGFVSSHWILFTVAICCTSHGERSGSDSSPASALLPDDRQRADKLYETVIDRLAFLNMSRSRQIVHKIWDTNQGGRVLVHWLGVIADFDWEIIFA